MYILSPRIRNCAIFQQFRWYFWFSVHFFCPFKIKIIIILSIHSKVNKNNVHKKKLFTIQMVGPFCFFPPPPPPLEPFKSGLSATLLGQSGIWISLNGELCSPGELFCEFLQIWLLFTNLRLIYNVFKNNFLFKILIQSI